MLHQLTKQHRAIEFKELLELIDKKVPNDLAVHVVLDDSSTHKTLPFSDGCSPILGSSCTSRRRRRG